MIESKNRAEYIKLREFLSNLSPTCQLLVLLSYSKYHYEVEYYRDLPSCSIPVLQCYHSCLSLWKFMEQDKDPIFAISNA